MTTTISFFQVMKEKLGIPLMLIQVVWEKRRWPSTQFLDSLTLLLAGSMLGAGIVLLLGRGF